MPQPKVRAMYRRTALAAVQCSMLGFAMCFANTPMTYEMSGLVHTDRYSNSRHDTLLAEYLQGLIGSKWTRQVDLFLDAAARIVYQQQHPGSKQE